jgi:hypothetical protein
MMMMMMMMMMMKDESIGVSERRTGRGIKVLVLEENLSQ